MKFDVTESKIKAAFIQIEGMNKNINENLDEIEDKQEYLENHSRRNNIKLLGVPEEDDENSWDDTELIVKTLIKNELGIQDEVVIERAHRVERKVQPRPQSKKEHRSHVESAQHQDLAQSSQNTILESERKHFKNWTRKEAQECFIPK